MTHHHVDPLVHFLNRLGYVRREHHFDAVFNEACELGADWQRSDGSDTITLHGVTAVGPTDFNAALNWIDQAVTTRPDLFRITDGRIVCLRDDQAVA